MIPFPAMLRPVLTVLILFAGCAGGAFAQEEAAPAPPDATETEAGETPPALLDSRVTTTPERARLVMDLTTPTEFAVYTLDDPRRAVVELRAQSSSDEEPGQPGGDGLVSGYTIDALGTSRVRLEMELSLPAQIQQSYILEAFEDQPARLVIDLVPDTPENFAANVRPQAGTGEVPVPEDAEEAEESPPVADSGEEEAVVLDGEVMAPGETATAPGETRPLIVIDPGHGGVDGGARSASGLEEKSIVLAFGLKLQNLLADTGRFDVALTRDTDVFLTLSERLALARANQADLFISLHADSFDQEDVRGASVYTRGDLATDDLDRVLAENENRVDLIAGFEPPEEEAAVDVLVDFLSRETRRQSYLAGQALIEQFEPSIQLRRFPLRQADFFVLNSPEIPSVLIELGFLSNSDDSENLATDAWLDRVAAALARGVAIYFDGGS